MNLPRPAQLFILWFCVAAMLFVLLMTWLYGEPLLKAVVTCLTAPVLVFYFALIHFSKEG
jgi:hypothetical protein